ncbi:MarR family transcriptional regulator [Paraburkholderia sp. JHI2823]|uniref:MarR family winged helix-turn-helix transcriptional regulator n=1 Tax=Paraburkholderia sp. JHI2823 TaxID=3112960 RepID=UPI00317C7ACA
MVPDVGEGKRGEGGHFGYLLRQAGAAHRLRMERVLADLGISGADLARLAVLTPQTVSVIVANLERSGAIVRRPHAVHRRIQQIDVTEEGRALLKQCRARVKKLEARMAAGFTSAEEQVIRSAGS